MFSLSRKSLSRRRRGLTLMEVMIASTVSAMVAGGILATFYWGIRTQVSVTDVNQVRLRAAGILGQLAQDVRNTTAGGYNNAAWPKLTANPATAPIVRLTLFDSMDGIRTIWTYTRATRRLSRSTENFAAGTAPSVQNFNVQFSNFLLQEISRAEWIGDSAALGTPNVTSIRILARVTPTLTSPGSIWTERDINHDGDFLDDEISAGLFAGTDAGDRVGWSFVFNSEAAFRNT